MTKKDLIHLDDIHSYVTSFNYLDKDHHNNTTCLGVAGCPRRLAVQYHPALLPLI